MSLLARNLNISFDAYEGRQLNGVTLKIVLFDDQENYRCIVSSTFAKVKKLNHEN